MTFDDTEPVTMRHVLRLAALISFCFSATAALAQSWVQVEAQPSEARALQRAEDYAGELQKVMVVAEAADAIGVKVQTVKNIADTLGLR